VLNTKAIGLKTNITVKGRRKGAMVIGTTYSNGKESGKGKLVLADASVN
jgi:hypothetical protein